MSKKTLSLVLIVLNEEAHLERCIKSAASLVDEIIVVDTGSTDASMHIATKCGAKVYSFEWIKDFSAARNYALEQSTSDWNLILDADEYIEHADIDAVFKFMDDGAAVGRIQNISKTFEEGEQSEVRNYITRLIQRGLKFSGRIHEQVNTELPRVNVPITVYHEGYLESNKSDRNIPLLLEEVKSHPDSSYYHYALAKEYRGIREIAKSITSFESAYRLLNGNERYAPNIIVDYLYVLIRDKQLKRALEIINKQHDIIRDYPDYYFACGVFYLDLIMSDTEKYLSYLPRIEEAYLKCIAIGEVEYLDSVAGTGSYAAWYNLGNYYEVLGQTDKAIQSYQNSASLGYTKAKNRLREM